MKVIIHFSEGEPPAQTIHNVTAIESDEFNIKFKLAPPDDAFEYEFSPTFVVSYEVFND